MDYDTINAGFAIAALVASTAALVIAAGFLATRLSAPRRQAWDRMRMSGTPLFAAAAWIVAAFCTFGSLYLQFGEHLIPCDLCWFQRICMYPQALLLGIAVITGDRFMVKRYMIPLSLVGMTISVLHIFLQPIMDAFHMTQFPGCSLVVPCTVQPVTEFGFMTIPYMALSGFVLITALLLLLREHPDGDQPGEATA